LYVQQQLDVTEKRERKKAKESLRETVSQRERERGEEKRRRERRAATWGKKAEETRQKRETFLSVAFRRHYTFVSFLLCFIHII
jgi:hypothetical protein